MRMPQVTYALTREMVRMDMTQLMEQARLMQQQLMDAQDNMADVECEGVAGGGVVRVCVTGDMKVTSVQIDPSVVDPEETEMLEDLVLTAMNAALEKANEASASEVANITGGLDLSMLF